MMTEKSSITPLECARQHWRDGQLREAEKICRQLLAQNQSDHGALHLLGLVAFGVGRSDDAIALIGKAIAHEPGNAELYNDLGIVLGSRASLAESIDCFRSALAMRWEYPEAHSNLGNVLRENKQIKESIDSCRQALTLRPNYPQALSNLGNALCDSDLADEAIDCYHAAIELDSEIPEIHNNLGNALRDKGLFDEAVQSYQTAIRLRPTYAEAFCNLAIAMDDLGRTAEAIANYRHAATLEPDNADLHRHLSFALLTNGHFDQGWKAYEKRWACKDFGTPLRPFPQPQWMGEELSGRSILLHAEQGNGDTIQFMRYVPLVASLGGRVILECQTSLVRCAQNLPGLERCVGRGEPLPSCDLHCPLMSLPLAFGTTLQTIPAQTPYLHADPATVQSWRSRLAGISAQHELKVGLVWGGNPDHINDRHRSIPLLQLAVLADVQRTRFFSLQKGPAAEQAQSSPPGLNLIDWTGDLADFYDTAALITALDLVITVDTSVAHLAGALGKPAWVLLPFASDWRWLLEREDSPWYPTLRLFRQQKARQWEDPIQRVVASLQKLVTIARP